MNLRKDQRHTVYIIMRAELENDPDVDAGFCYLLMELNGGQPMNEIITLMSLPELYKQRPHSKFGSYWFPLSKEGKARRLSILDNCIELTY